MAKKRQVKRKKTTRRSVAKARNNARKPVKKTYKNPNAGLVFVGFMFLGIGVGKLLDITAAGTLIGMAVGFLAMYKLKNG